MFIVVNKIISKYQKDEDGNIVKHPDSEKPLMDGVKIVEETIRIDEIKSVRPWNKAGMYSGHVPGSVTSLYMLDRSSGRNERFKPAEIHIAEDYKDFNKRIGAISKDDGKW